MRKSSTGWSIQSAFIASPLLEHQESFVKDFRERIECIDDVCNGTSKIRVPLPEAGFHSQYTCQEITFIEISSGEWIVLQVFNGQRNQIFQTEVLSDHDSE